MTVKKKTISKNIEVMLNPQQRKNYLRKQLAMDGLLGFIKENPLAAYCAVSLTNTPDMAKPHVKERQNELANILADAGISAYDPGNAPLSPDLNLTSLPEEIYKTDLARVAGARFFTAFDTFPSTGMGVEMEAARRYNRIAVIFHDESIRTSRMQPSCAIHLQISDLTTQKKQLIKLFQLLKQYEPGRGIYKKQPLLLGFKNDEAIDLATLVNKKFPELVYTFDGTKPNVQFTILNHEVLFFAEKIANK